MYKYPSNEMPNIHANYVVKQWNRPPHRKATCTWGDCPDRAVYDMAVFTADGLVRDTGKLCDRHSNLLSMRYSTD